MIINGKLKKTINKARFKLYNSCTKRDIPVMPPSKKWFGTKNDFRANAAIITPNTT